MSVCPPPPSLCQLGHNRLEDLRAELHQFGCLTPEGGLSTLGEELRQALADPELDAFFRKTGGLKAELGGLSASLLAPEMIYPDKLADLRNRLEVLVVSVNLAEVLEAQGKAGDRKTCQATVDTIRQAKRSDLPPILPSFHVTLSSCALCCSECTVLLCVLVVCVPVLFVSYVMCACAMCESVLSCCLTLVCVCGAPPLLSSPPQRQVGVLAAVEGIHPRTAAALNSAKDTLQDMLNDLEEAKKAMGGTTVAGSTR